MLFTDADAHGELGLRADLGKNAFRHLPQREALMVVVAHLLAGEDADFSGPHEHGQRIRQTLAEAARGRRRFLHGS